MSLITLEYKDIFDENIDKKLQFSKDLLQEPYNLKSLFVVKVDGKSMEPLIKDKSLVVADLSQKAIENDAIYLVYKDDRMWIKKAKIENSIEFISINKEYSHLIYKKEEIHLVAKVLLTFTNL